MQEEQPLSLFAENAVISNPTVALIGEEYNLKNLLWCFGQHVNVLLNQSTLAAGSLFQTMTLDEIAEKNPLITFICLDDEKESVKLIKHYLDNSDSAVVVRSFIPPEKINGLCEELYARRQLHRVIFSPIISAESEEEFRNPPHLVLGSIGNAEQYLDFLQHCTNINTNSYHPCSPIESAIVTISKRKLVQSRTQSMNELREELYQLHSAGQCSYMNVERAIISDPRVGYFPSVGNIPEIQTSLTPLIEYTENQEEA